MFYDSGGNENSYGKSENHTIIFYPENPRGKLNVNFNAFDVEPTSSGGCWDYLSFYDGDSLNSNDFVDDYCNSNKPTTYTATNDKGALGFTFYSDASVTHSGWEAVIENAGYFVKFVVTNTNDEKIENALVEFEEQEKYTNSDGIATFTYIPEGSELPFQIRTTGYNNDSGSVDIYSDTTLNVMLESGLATFDVSFNVLNENDPLEGACVAVNNDTLYTDNNGNAVFNGISDNTTVSFEITKEHFNPVNDSFVINGSNVTKEILMDKKQYRITFKVTDGYDPIENASITHHDKDEYTDKNGEFAFDLTYALDQEFLIKKSGFNDSDTIIDIESERSIVVALQSTTDIGKTIDREIIIYPNPTHGELNIEINNAESIHYSIKIYDVLGKLIYADDLYGNQNIRQNVDLSEHPKGLYFLNIKSNRGDNISKRFIIQ